MRVKTISVMRHRTINRGNFESTRLEFGATAELDDDDIYEVAMDVLDKMVRKTMRDEVKRVVGILTREAAAADTVEK